MSVAETLQKEEMAHRLNNSPLVSPKAGSRLNRVGPKGEIAVGGNDIGVRVALVSSE